MFTCLKAGNGKGKAVAKPKSADVAGADAVEGSNGIVILPEEKAAAVDVCDPAGVDDKAAHAPQASVLTDEALELREAIQNVLGPDQLLDEELSPHCSVTVTEQDGTVRKVRLDAFIRRINKNVLSVLARSIERLRRVQEKHNHSLVVNDCVQSLRESVYPGRERGALSEGLDDAPVFDEIDIHDVVMTVFNFGTLAKPDFKYYLGFVKEIHGSLSRGRDNYTFAELKSKNVPLCFEWLKDVTADYKGKYCLTVLRLNVFVCIA